MIEYNVQVAVDTDHHLITAHEVMKERCDRTQLERYSNYRASEVRDDF